MQSSPRLLDSSTSAAQLPHRQVSASTTVSTNFTTGMPNTSDQKTTTSTPARFAHCSTSSNNDSVVSMTGAGGGGSSSIMEVTQKEDSPIGTTRLWLSCTMVILVYIIVTAALFLTWPKQAVVAVQHQEYKDRMGLWKMAIQLEFVVVLMVVALLANMLPTKELCSAETSKCPGSCCGGTDMESFHSSQLEAATVAH